MHTRSQRSLKTKLLPAWLLALAIALTPLVAQTQEADTEFIPVPPSLQAAGMPPIPVQQVRDADRYMRFAGESFRGWHPSQRAIMVSFRIGELFQFSLLPTPDAKPQMLVQSSEPISDGALVSGDEGDMLVYQTDKNGNEQFQLTALNLKTLATRVLTDGASRNTGMCVSRDGSRVAYASTRRNGKDNDIFVSKINTTGQPWTRSVLQGTTASTYVYDWSLNDISLLSRRTGARGWMLTSVATGKSLTITQPVAGATYTDPRLAEADKAIYALCETSSAMRAVVRIDVATGKQTPLSEKSPWEVESYALSPDGQILAYVLNEDGFSRLRLMNMATRRQMPVPDMPKGIIYAIAWHSKLHELGFNLNTSQSPTDAYSLNADTGILTRWSSRKAPAAKRFADPELIHVKSFDGLQISALVYRPDPKKFPPPRPVIVSFHGGPSSQARPEFLRNDNYFINELGIALVYPNVRGSSGYGRAFLDKDNGYKREDALKDAGAIFDWIRKDKNLDATRMGVMGGSYGGYMVLATLVRYNDRIRCGVDRVGISNFVSFLQHTADYRRDNRRREYGDERDQKMSAFLDGISPANHVDEIRAPLFIIQGENDPRVAQSESENMRNRLQQRNAVVWYLSALNEGHGFKKRSNVDYQFHATVMFFKKYLLE